MEIILKALRADKDFPEGVEACVRLRERDVTRKTLGHLHGKHVWAACPTAHAGHRAGPSDSRQFGILMKQNEGDISQPGHSHHT